MDIVIFVTKATQLDSAVQSAMPCIGPDTVLVSLINGLGGQYVFNPIGFEFLGNWWSHGKIYGDQVSFTEPDDTGCEVMVLWGSNSYVTHQMCDARKNIREESR